MFKGMREVTVGEFFTVMRPLDVHPSVRLPDRTDWELRDRTLVGVSLPGWKEGGNPNVAKRWFVKET